MRTLLSVLDEAVRRSATQVLLESGRPVVFTTARGREAEQESLPRTELFDMIVAAVDADQQVELAVGNPVEFSVEASGPWQVQAEPGKEGICVRASRSMSDELSIELDEGGFDLAPPGVDPGPRAGAEDLAFDDDRGSSILDRPELDDLDVPDLAFDASESSSPPVDPAPFESGTWALADEDELDLDLDGRLDEDSLPTGFDDRASSGSAAGDTVGVPEDDDEDEFDPVMDPGPSERERGHAPTVQSPAATPRKGAPSSAPTRSDLAPMASHETRPDLAKQPGSHPEGDTRRELPSAGSSDASLGRLAGEIEAGTLLYVFGAGLAEAVAAAGQAPTVTLDDRLDLAAAWAKLEAMPVGAIVIVRREDPSELLPWLLRRLEEGCRVFLETRARTPQGARRILLGVDASERAERWLDAHTQRVLQPGDEGPTLGAVPWS